MFTASQLVAFVISMIGMPYWYGTCVYMCSESTLNSKTRQYPEHYTSSRMEKYRKAIAEKKVCTDCVGMIKGFFWTNGGEGVADYIKGGAPFKNKYASNGCPDKSANGMLAWCKSNGCANGKINTLPDVPGVLLFAPGHVGVYIGNGYAVEARGFNYGVVKTQVKGRTWTEWAYLPESLLKYDTASGEDIQVVPIPNPTQDDKLGSRIIKLGVEGKDVTELQTALVKLGYKLGTYGPNKDGVDGDCGAKTVAAIKAFQRDYGLGVDGEFGEESYAKLVEVLAKESGNKPTGDATFKIKVTGNTVNVRTAPSTATGKIKYVVKNGDILTATGIDTATGWFRLNDGNYISNKYAVKA